VLAVRLGEEVPKEEGHNQAVLEEAQDQKVDQGPAYFPLHPVQDPMKTLGLKEVQEEGGQA
jgi:hypothetical protein